MLSHAVHHSRCKLISSRYSNRWFSTYKRRLLAPQSPLLVRLLFILKTFKFWNEFVIYHGEQVLQRFFDTLVIWITIRSRIYFSNIQYLSWRKNRNWSMTRPCFATSPFENTDVNICKVHIQYNKWSRYRPVDWSGPKQVQCHPSCPLTNSSLLQQTARTWQSLSSYKLVVLSIKTICLTYYK